MSAAVPSVWSRVLPLRLLLLTGLLALAWGQAIADEPKPERTVFLHVVPWYPPNSGKRLPDSMDPSKSHPTLAIDETEQSKRVEQHLLAIQAAGIDVVALDVMIRTGWKPGHNPKSVLWHGPQVRAWLDAMEKVAPDMRFCVQLDRAGGEVPSTEVWPAALETIETNYASHPNYYRVGGKPALLSFWLNEKVSDKLLKDIFTKTKADFHVVGSIVENPGKELGGLTRARINLPRVDQAIDLFDGIDVCPLGAHLSWLKNSHRAISPRVRAAGKPLYWGVATGYYRRRVAFIEPAYTYLNDLWMLAIRDKAENVIIWTWNDVAEDHDIFPSRLKGRAVLDLMSLYISWYKTGQFPALEHDRIFISYPAINGGRKGPGGGEDPTWPNLNYFAWMTAPGELEIPGIGKASLQKGLNVGQLGPTKAGLPNQFELRRDGKTVRQGPVPDPMEQDTPETPENLKYRWAEL